MKETVYHYTNLQAFLSIINSQCLRATEISKLNDPQERKAGYKHAKREAKNRAEALNTIDFYKRIVSSSRSKPHDDNVFVLSMSEEKDLLSQWSSYADNATGVAIGINRKKMWDNISSYNGILKEVSYGKKRFKLENKKLINEILKCQHEHEELEIKFNESSEEKEIEEIHDEMRSLLLKKLSQSLEIDIRSCFYKERFYCEEKEVRVCVHGMGLDSSNIKYRNTTYGLSPYIDIPIVGCIEEVILAPNCLNSKKDIEKFLSISGIDAKVKSSKGKYR